MCLLELSSMPMQHTAHFNTIWKDMIKDFMFKKAPTITTKKIIILFSVGIFWRGFGFGLLN